MQLADRKELISDELSALEDSFAYEDHRLFEEGRYAEIACRFQNRARRMLWFGSFFSAVFAIFAALTFVDYGAEGNTMDLIVGAGYAAIAQSAQFYWTRSGARMSAAAGRTLRLLEESEAAVSAEPQARQAAL